MTARSVSRLAFLALCLSVGGALPLAGPALADPPWQDQHGHDAGPQGRPEGFHGHGPASGGSPHEERHNGPHSMPQGGHGDKGWHFDDPHRAQIAEYMREKHHGNCPPGLMKKHNRCRPPGQNRKYHIGGVLPHGYRPVPPDLQMRLGPPPQGAFYAVVDNDVLLVTEAGKKILDAVTLLSAVQ